jgi:ketosteroid isomerase-like protein
MSDIDNLAAARSYIAALSSGAGADEIERFYAPDVVQEEFPNRLLPNGATRDREALRQARIRGQALLSAESFELLGAVASGNQVAMELHWTGTVATSAGPFTAGQTLRARFALFLEFRDGRIVRQRNYDCFEPWDGDPARSIVTKPDFSGNYVLDRQASILSAGADAIERGEVRIEHREPVFRYSATFGAGDRTVEYSFELPTDGREDSPGGSDASRLYWDGTALVSEHRTTTPNAVITMSWRYQLIDNGRHLRATEQLRGAGRDQDNVWEFERR